MTSLMKTFVQTKLIDTPMDPNVELPPNREPLSDQRKYRKLLMEINYLTTLPSW